MMENSRAYVTPGDKCRDGDTQITTAEVPVFAYDSTDTVLFNLCEHGTFCCS
ncbi:MAG: hypothetical protein IRD7MM_00245 [Candidatus Midichloria mitochondrii]|nr:hypothetical protein [Candidatus Midichloria mitochondrii]